MARGRRTQRAPRAVQQENDTTIIQCEIQADHVTVIRQTEDFYKSQRTVKDHYRRLAEMINWVKVEYPGYYSESVRDLSEEDLYSIGSLQMV